MSHHCHSNGGQKKYLKNKKGVEFAGGSEIMFIPSLSHRRFKKKYIYICLSSNNLICLVCQTALVSLILCKKIFKYISTFWNEMPKYNVVVYYL